MNSLKKIFLPLLIFFILTLLTYFSILYQRAQNVPLPIKPLPPENQVKKERLTTTPNIAIDSPSLISPPSTEVIPEIKIKEKLNENENENEKWPSPPPQIKLINHPNPNVDKIVIREMKRFLENSDDENFDVKVEKEKKYILTTPESKLGRYVENVLIKTIDPQNENIIYSFRAQIDAETGEIYQSWDKNTFHKTPIHRGENEKLKLTPTGFIKGQAQ
jgi:hypothetical protein